MSKRSLPRIPLPTQDFLKSELIYDPMTGALRWRQPKQGRRMERPVGCADPRGVRLVGINYTQYMVHRLIWKLVYGEDPDEIDHINGNPSDNRLANLRSVSHHINQRNMKLRSTNKSGYCGLYRHKNGRWRVDIRDDSGKRRHLGYFADKADAIAARKAAEQELGYHPMHGTAKA